MTDRSIVAHVLRRLTFGPTAGEVDAAVRDGLAATVDRVLAPPGPVAYPSLPAAGKGDRQAIRNEAAEAVAWWVGQMAAHGGNGAEKLTFFWHGHWATSVQKVRSATLMLTQQKTFRTYGPGPTGPLVRAMLRDPALILWLDGQKNTRKAPNENLARESMELFTLGVGHYTEDDVKAAARVLTGWTVDRRAGASRLVPNRHATEPVTLLGRTGPLDVDGYADLLVRHPRHVPFLASRVWLRYGGTDPAPVSLTAAGNDVPAMLRALALDPAFPRTAGQLVKQPVEWVTGAVRQLGVDPAEAGKPLQAALRALGQVPFRPPSVGGWPAGEAWLTTAAAQARLRTGQALAALATAKTQELAEAAETDRLDALARVLVVDAWTDRTAAVLKQAAKDPGRLLAIGLATPEYTVC